MIYKAKVIHLINGVKRESNHQKRPWGVHRNIKAQVSLREPWASSRNIRICIVKLEIRHKDGNLPLWLAIRRLMFRVESHSWVFEMITNCREPEWTGCRDQKHMLTSNLWTGRYFLPDWHSYVTNLRWDGSVIRVLRGGASRTEDTTGQNKTVVTEPKAPSLLTGSGRCSAGHWGRGRWGRSTFLPSCDILELQYWSDRQDVPSRAIVAWLLWVMTVMW